MSTGSSFGRHRHLSETRFQIGIHNYDQLIMKQKHNGTGGTPIIYNHRTRWFNTFHYSAWNETDNL